MFWAASGAEEVRKMFVNTWVTQWRPIQDVT